MLCKAYSPTKYICMGGSSVIEPRCWGNGENPSTSLVQCDELWSFLVFHTSLQWIIPCSALPKSNLMGDYRKFTLATSINLIIIGSASLPGIFCAINNLLRRLRISLCTSSLSLFSDSGGDRIKKKSLKSRGGIWLSHVQHAKQSNLLMNTAKPIETYFQKWEALNILSIYIWGWFQI